MGCAAQRQNMDITILQEVFQLADCPEMYTPCLPLTSSDEYVHVVGQYMKPFASTPKSRGEKGKGSALSQFHHQWKQKNRRIPLAKQHVFLIRRHTAIERVRKKLSNMLLGVVSKSIRDYFLPMLALLFCGLQLWSRKPSRLYPSRRRLGWKLFIFSNQWLECLTKYK